MSSPSPPSAPGSRSSRAMSAMVAILKWTTAVALRLCRHRAGCRRALEGGRPTAPSCRALPGRRTISSPSSRCSATTISPYLFFWQSSQEAEDEQDTPGARPADAGRRSRRRPRSTASAIDTYFGMGFSNLVSLFIIITTAATLHANGITDIQNLCPGGRGAAADRRPLRLRRVRRGDHRKPACSPCRCWPGRLPTRSARRSAGRSELARRPARCQGVLWHDRGSHADRHRHQLHQHRSDQGAVSGAPC